MHLVLHHYWRSSSSWRVRWALAHKGLAWDGVAVDLLAGAQRDEVYVAERSPAGLVPCLVVDGRPLTESVAIVELLEELAPTPSLYPAEPFARARVRQLVELVNAGTQPIQNLSVLRHVSSLVQGVDADVQRAWARHFIERGLAAVERDLGLVAREGLGGRFAVGDALTAADLYLVPQLYNARRFGVDLASFPRLLAAEAAALDTDAARASHPDRFAP
ncbi:MAG: maleylacetoacetate isomerase [Myxococcales bacterium]|nr:maleylacetoacetate isomerase [Myxococcales bacterium]